MRLQGCRSLQALHKPPASLGAPAPTPCMYLWWGHCCRGGVEQEGVRRKVPKAGGEQKAPCPWGPTGAWEQVWMSQSSHLPSRSGHVPERWKTQRRKRQRQQGCMEPAARR